MSRRSHSNFSLSNPNISLDISEIHPKPPLYASSKKIDIVSMEVEIMKDRYQKEYNQFHRAFHKRSKSQMEKINRIIRDANDLNEILDGGEKWLAKRKSGEEDSMFNETCVERGNLLEVPIPDRLSIRNVRRNRVKNA